MKLVTFNSDGTDRVGVILGDEVAPLDAATTPAFASLRSLLEAGPDALDAAGRAGNEAAERLPLAGLRLRAPIPRPVQMRDALCFEKHLRQARANRYLFGQGTARVPPEEIEVPQVWYDQPIYYKGNRFAVSGPEDEILWPKGETKLDYELEIWNSRVRGRCRVFRDGFGGRERGSRLARRGDIPMTKQQKITLSASRDIPFNKLMLSQSNVRHVKAGVSIEELAEDIARRTLLSSITVRPVLDDSGAETGMYTIPAGGRRFRALELLVKQKRMNKTALVPCIVRTDGLAEEDSLAENVQRAPLHPLDQFRAFQAMREKGRTEEEIAAAFFVPASVVKQRLKLAAVAPSLLDAYAEEEMTLDQLMAFTVNPDHARQEQVWEALQRHYSRQPYEIRRMLTEGAVRASDKRAQFVGLDDYVEAGGEILRDLFQQDDGGWLQDAALLDVMVREKLAEEAEGVRAEGWKWVEVDTEFPYGHTFGMRRVHGEAVPMSDEEAASYQALKAEYDALEAEHAEADELPDEVDVRLGEIEEAMEALEARPIRYEAEDLALAGAFVSIDSSGRLRVERGYVRPEDEPVEEVEDISEVHRMRPPRTPTTPSCPPRRTRKRTTA
jgi:ParB/RepB/Spo0J family partition protein